MQKELCSVRSHSYSLHLALTAQIKQLFTAVTCQFFKGCLQYQGTRLTAALCAL